MDCKLLLTKRFNFTIMGKAKRYIGIRIRQGKSHIMIDQNQCIKHIASRFEKLFKHIFKLKDSSLSTSFVQSKKDCPNTETRVKEVKFTFGKFNYRSILGTLLYVSFCTRPDITYTQLRNLLSSQLPWNNPS